jgi:hypothetical protein
VLVSVCPLFDIHQSNRASHVFISSFFRTDISNHPRPIPTSNILIMSGNLTANPNSNPTANSNGQSNGNPAVKLNTIGRPNIPPPPARIHTKEDAEFLQSLHRRAQAIREA